MHNTHEWHDFYNRHNVEDLRRFLDHVLKGENNALGGMLAASAAEGGGSKA
ncbi:hypothetical protein [Streptomyces sp. NPDC056227]|uniref:hypothetical protein n=1 Tax=Streptomyces sp. NPDC056227 TaxID=3345753 RepID=UPI0035DB10E4